ncbi:MAG: DUF456 domain-containing protein [Rikenellaceae bacterium]
MDLALSLVAITFAALGIVGAVVPGLPGALLSFGALLVAYFCSMPPVTVAELFIYLAISLVVTVADLYLPIYFTRRFGGSRSGVVGSTVGMVVGFFAFPPLGFVICPYVGAVLGELLNDRNDVERAFKVGGGVFVSFLCGTGVKFFYALWVAALLMTHILPAALSGVRSFVDSF